MKKQLREIKGFVWGWGCHKKDGYLRSHLVELLARAGDDPEDVVAHGLRERAALADDDVVTDGGLEAQGAVNGEVLVALHVTLVLVHEVQVVAADDDRPLHLGGADLARMMRPRIDTLPVNGHLASMYLPSTAVFGVLKPRPIDLT